VLPLTSKITISSFRLLITAFEPFGERTSNTSGDLLAEMRKSRPKTGFSSYRFVILPVDFRHAWPRLRNQLYRHKPHAVLLLGEKAATSFTLETAAHNKRVSARGFIPITKNSPQRITSPLPVRKIGTRLQRRLSVAKNVLSVGDDPGTYLCNFIYYKILSAKRNIPSLFVHVPALSHNEFKAQRKKFLSLMHNIASELIKAIDGAGAKYTSREN
jgi:pyroglutamyl-peptidase